MKQQFLVTVESNEQVSPKEIADALNYGTGSFSLGENHNDVILAKVRKASSPANFISKEELNRLAKEKYPEPEYVKKAREAGEWIASGSSSYLSEREAFKAGYLLAATKINNNNEKD